MQTSLIKWRGVPREAGLLALFIVFILHAPINVNGAMEILGPEGGNFRAILAIDQEKLFTGTEDGRVFRSTDGGATWRENRDLPFSPSTIIEQFANGDHGIPLYLAARDLEGGGGLYRSLDYGVTWEAVLTGLAVRSIDVDPRDPTVIYLGTEKKIFISRDSGKSWSITPFDFPDPQIESILVDPHQPSTVYAGSWQRAFKSTDYGQRWFPIHDGMASDSDVFCLAAASDQPGLLFAGTCGWVYRSLNGGRQWQRIREGLQTKRFHSVIVMNDGIAYGGSDKGLYSFDPKTLRWRLIGELPLVIHDLTQADDRWVFGATEGHGIFRLDTTTGRYEWLNNGLIASSPYALHWLDDDGNRLLVGTRTQNSGNLLYVLDTRNRHWQEILDENLPGFDFLTMRTWSDHIWVGTSAGLLQMTLSDEGIELVEKHLTSRAVEHLFPITRPVEGLAVATTSGMVIIRQDPDGAYTTVPIEKFNGVDVRALWAPPERSDRTFAGTDQGLYFFSERFGVWLRSDMKLDSPSINALCGNDSGSLLLVASELGLYLSQDGGISFSHLASGVPERHCALCAMVDGIAYALFPDGVFLAGAGAAFWERLETDPGFSSIWSFTISPDRTHIYLGSDGHGLARIPLTPK